MFQKNQEIVLSIDAVSNDGNGIGRYDGIVVFVPYSAVNDELLVRIVRVEKQHAYGKILTILCPSPSRIDADCPSFGRCGGCSFRHIDYGEELRLKKEFVADSLTRIGRLHVNVKDTIASSKEEQYRNKVQLPVFEDNDGLQVGFYAQRSHRIVPFTDGCRLEPAEFVEIADVSCRILKKQGMTAYDERSHTGLLRHIVLRKSSIDGSVLLALVINGSSLLKEGIFAEEIARMYPQIKNVVINNNNRDTNVILSKDTRALLGDGYLYDRLAGINLRLSLPSFLQINHAAAELLYEKIRTYAAPEKNQTLLDLYCGVGSISLSLAHAYKKVIGVEVVAAAVEDANYNARMNGIHNTEFLQSDAKEASIHFLREGVRPDCIIVDPPRRGCDIETLSAIRQMNPSRIVMVSCNPATFARDLQRLDSLGYRLEEVTPVDMFPRTNHVESVALLRKNKG